ncbi:MAG: DUF262 domain-containing protein [Deltaproteobacteria bacterium]|nr:DUF262 domain-containing protein [Deltaproteobacteria bacterium]
MEWFKDRYVTEVPISGILDCLDEKKLRLPLYQRDAVWSVGRICALWDSLLRGFPLPSFLLVKGDGSGRALAGDKARCKVVSDDTEAYYAVLDGQQRLWAIIAGAGKDPGIRLWVDLAPPEKYHPLRFQYWLHPCTRAFPFGFRMEASGEHDFHPLHDRSFQEIWECMQRTEHAGKEFYEIPPDTTFPWEAGCPVPLSVLLTLDTSSDGLNNHIDELIQTQRAISDKYGRLLREPNPEVLQKVINGLKRIGKARLTLQYIDLNDLEQDEGGGYALFERIGRGGLQISPRQLAVSKLMLVLGKEGNDALASFQKSGYGCLLETEDVIHALARVALAEVKTASHIGEERKPDDMEKADKHDLSELSVERLQSLKKNGDVWASFIKRLRTYCEPLAGDPEQTILGFAFDRVFRILKFDPQSNPNGFPLVQLAKFSRDREGVAPITLHPLLLWQLKYSGSQPPDSAHRDEMLRWILFANGLTNMPQHTVLNREMFDQVNTTGHFSFAEILDKIFKDEGQNKLLQGLGFQWSEPSLRESGEVEDVMPDRKALPTPTEVVTLTAKRLILRNSVYSGISDFILMWNQREGLYEMYGKVEPKHIPSLFGKGRPFDADHIVARNRLLRIALDEEVLRQGCSVFFKDDYHATTHFVKDWCFRKNLPNITGNYRYWPKRLNRSDSNDSVTEKMSMESILESLGGHPLFGCFEQEASDISWSWSAIPQEDRANWMNLPPSDSLWTADLVEQFIQVLLQREYFLYRNAYTFLTGEPAENFECHGII